MTPINGYVVRWLLEVQQDPSIAVEMVVNDIVTGALTGGLSKYGWLIKKAGEEALGALFELSGIQHRLRRRAPMWAHCQGSGAGSLRLVYGDGQITFVDKGWPAVLEIQGPFTATTPIDRNTQISLPCEHPVSGPDRHAAGWCLPTNCRLSGSSSRSPRVSLSASRLRFALGIPSITSRPWWTCASTGSCVHSSSPRSSIPTAARRLHIMQASLAPPFNLEGGANTIVATVVDAYGSTASATLAVQVSGAPRPPKNLRVQGGDGKALVSWTANLEADVVAYNLVRSTAGGPASPVTAQPLTAPVWLDEGLTNGTLYAYPGASDRPGGKAQRSDEPGVGDGRGAAAGVCRRRSCPPNVVATPGDRQIEITWTPTGTQPIAYRVLAADMRRPVEWMLPRRHTHRCRGKA